MRVFILWVSLLFAITLSAQTDSAFQSSIAPTYTSVQTLTRSDIERLPVFSFMQLVQGAFPFIGNESTVEEEYSFVVNGFVLTNPNAINLSQIESISFIPVGTNLTRGSLTKKGTFIINTRPGKNGFSFSTHTGWTLSKEHNNSPFTELTQTRKGFSSLNDISYTHRSKKWFLSDAFSFLKGESPQFQIKISQPTYSETDHTSSRSNRFRFSNFGGYEFNKHWKAEGGFFFTVKEGAINTDRTAISNYNNPPTSETVINESKPKVNYIGGNIAITSIISKAISNRLSGEIAKYRDNDDYRSDYNWMAGRGFIISNSRYHSTEYSVSNLFLWQHKISSSLNTNFSMYAQYRHGKSYQKRDSLDQFTPLTGTVLWYNAGAIYENSTRGVLVSPEVNVDFKDIVFAEAGISYDTYGTADFGKNIKKKLLPDVGARIELSSFLKNSTISTLEIAGNYSKYLTNFERYDKIGTSLGSNRGNSLSFLPFAFANPYLYGYPPVKSWLFSAAIGFSQNRFLFKVQYRNLERAVKAYAAAPWYGNMNTTFMLIDKLQEKGFCFELKASIIKKEKVKWDLYTTTFLDKYSRQYKQYPPITEDVILMDAGKAPWRSSLRTSLTMNKFFMQVSSLINFNELAIDRNDKVKNDLNRYDCNYLVIGYSIPLKNKLLKEVKISAESSGFFASKSWILAKYAGVGAAVNF